MSRAIKTEPGNGFAYLRGAASGNVDAMRSLVFLGMEQIAEEPDVLTLTEALVFARMAAAVGDRADTAMLVSVLTAAIGLLEGQEHLSGYRDQLQGEGIAIASRLADEGVEAAEQVLPAMVESASARVAGIAKDFVVRMAAI